MSPLSCGVGDVTYHGSVKTWALLAGPVLGMATWAIATGQGLASPACWTAAVTVLCATWWVTEPIPIPATSLIPFGVLPLTGVLTHQQAASAYGHTLILLFLGGFILSGAMERSQTHRRLAYGMLRCVGGTSGRRVVLGFMLASAALSMWISNTATVLMLLPITAAVLDQIDDPRLSVALVLGIAYGANIGGLGTPIGSPPNLIYMGIYEEITQTELSFVDWMRVGLPIVLVFLPVAWGVLTWRVRVQHPIELPPVGRWEPAEVRTLTVFGVTALAWVTRTTPYGGWSGWLAMPGVGDSTVALLAAIAVFIIPDGRGDRLMDWETARKIPWGILLLFGGGLAIAKGFGESGLSQVLGDLLSGITGWTTVWMVLTICLSVTFLTEVTSNTATATMLMPILAAAAMSAQLRPASLMLPAAISASCAFMLPVATPPNAIVFGTGRVTIRRMAREGVALNLLGAVIITAICLLLNNH